MKHSQTASLLLPTYMLILGELGSRKLGYRSTKEVGTLVLGI